MSRTSSSHFTYKFGPYDHYQGDPGIKLPPLFINSVIFLETYGLEEEGLMHLRGNENSIRRLRRLLNEGPLELSVLSDVHSVTTILKEFFIGAPSSLLPEENYSSFISVADSRQFTLEGIRDQLTNIPLSHQRVLHRLLIFFRSVLKQCNKNKVKLESIVVQYGPIILRRPPNMTITPVDAEMHSNSMFKLICKLLDNHVNLFEGIGLNYAGPEPVTWSKLSLGLSNRNIVAKYTIPIELYNPSIKEAEENTERVRNRLTEASTRMSEKYKRAKEKRLKILNEAKDKAVREWLYTKHNFDEQKTNFDRFHQNWQAACDRVAATNQEFDEARSEYVSLQRYYGVEEHAPSSSTNSSPLTRVRLTMPSSSSGSPPWVRERGLTDPVRPTLSSPPIRPVSTSFSGSPIRPKIMRRSSDPPLQFRTSQNLVQLEPLAEHVSPEQSPQQSTQQPSPQQSPQAPHPSPQQSPQQSRRLQQSPLQSPQPSPQPPQQPPQPPQQEVEPLPQQQQRKLQVHQQLMQTLQNQFQPNTPPTPIRPLPPPTSPALGKKQSPKFPFLLTQTDATQHSPRSSPQPSPVQSPQNSPFYSPQVPLRAPKSLPPIPPSSSPSPKTETRQFATDPPSPQQQSIQILQEQERRQALPRSYSDDQTKSKHPSHDLLSRSPSIPHSPSLPDLPSLVAEKPVLTEKTGKTTLNSSATDRSSQNSSVTEKSVLTSSGTERSVLNSSSADRLGLMDYAALRPDEIAHLEEAQAQMEFLEAELELNKFEMLMAEKEKKRAEMPYDLAQVEHWKATQGIRRLDISDEEAEGWQP